MCLTRVSVLLCVFVPHRAMNDLDEEELQMYPLQKTHSLEERPYDHWENKSGIEVKNFVNALTKSNNYNIILQR